MLVFFIITVAAAEVAVGLALIVALYRKRRTAHVEDLTTHETLTLMKPGILPWMILFLPLLAAALITLFTLQRPQSARAFHRRDCRRVRPQRGLHRAMAGQPASRILRQLADRRRLAGGFRPAGSIR